jgi:hypothetical protein
MIFPARPRNFGGFNGIREHGSLLAMGILVSGKANLSLRQGLTDGVDIMLSLQDTTSLRDPILVSK